MEAPALGWVKLSPVNGFEQLAELRAQRHERLRGRNNATSCRSPMRDIDTKLIKDELKKKRHWEFLKRRSLSPEISPKPHGRWSHTSIQISPTGLGMTVPQSNRQVRLGGQERGQPPSSSASASLQNRVSGEIHTRRPTSASASTTSTSVFSTHKAQRTEIKPWIQPGSPGQSESRVQRRLRDAGVQTDSGIVNVKESDIQLLAEYLQEALWREEAVKKKLAVLQESTSNLVNSSDFIWTSRCSEDLLRTKISALEEQLQVCLQKFPKDGVKKLALQMERQKALYEEKALAALQKVTQDKTEAVGKAATFQEALVAAKAETVRWRNLYEEMKKSSEESREDQRLSREQLEQLHHHVEISRSREAELGQEVALLEQQKQELLYSISLLEGDNQALRDDLQQLRVDSESQDFVVLKCPPAEEADPEEPGRRELLEEQLHHTQEKLRLKESECEELQAELSTMEQECKSSQARLSQCRDELRQLSHHRRRPKLPGCGCWVWMFSLLLLTLLQASLLWVWHPPFRHQLEDVYTDIGKRVENYLMEAASSKPCFKPL